MNSKRRVRPTHLLHSYARLMAYPNAPIMIILNYIITQLTIGVLDFYKPLYKGTLAQNDFQD